MKPKINLGDSQAVEQASRLFAAFHTVEQLTADDTPAVMRPSFSRLYAYVGETDIDAEIEAALAADVRLRRDYRHLINKFSVPFVPRVLAADSGAESLREGIGCRLRFIPSTAEPSQTYVIIEFVESTNETTSTLFLCDRFDNCQKVSLTAEQGGKVQLLLDNNSDLLARLMDKDIEIRRSL
ncbi:MAG: hypothetical protein CMM54_11025 [Rhodospirillaceae bacterium]|nr:hypothetical protein [Rhodospirillaceae bacterium]